MRALFITLSSFIGFLGLIFIIEGCRHPSRYQEVLSDDTSAVQVTQVYTEAMHQTTIGIGIVGIAVLVAVIGILLQTRAALNSETGSTDNF